jgi:hypothetical protein
MRYWFIIVVVILLGAWTHGGVVSAGAWILTTHFWADTGVWLDTATWND